MPLHEEQHPTAVDLVTPPTSSTELSRKVTSDTDAAWETFTTTSYPTLVAHDAPVSLALSFSRVVLAGHESSLIVQIKNLTRDPLEQVEILIESHWLETSVSEKVDRLPPGQLVRLLVKIEPVRAGNFILQCSVKLKAKSRRKGFVGNRSLYVNPPPTDPSRAVAPSEIFTNLAANSADPRGETLNRVPGGAVLDSLNELLLFKLPERFQPLILAQQFDEDARAAENSAKKRSRQLIIDRMFLGYVQPGTLLRLTPPEGDATLPIHLIARPRFKLGRSRTPDDGADLITWLMPRSRANDDKTRHLSRVHAILELNGDRLFLRDNHSDAGSTYDGQPLSSEEGELLRRKAVLVLAGEYFIEIERMAPGYSGEPEVSNISLWKGPATPPKPCGGAVRFTPLNSELAHHNASWLFTDAAFGTSRSNTIILDVPGLAEIQGRFHHFRGCFWVENRVANEGVRINSRILPENSFAPLMNGLMLQIGSTIYRVEVLA